MFSRFDRDREPADEDLDLWDESQRIVLEFTLLWSAADHRRAQAAGMGCGPPAGGPHHPRGRFVVPAEAEIRGHDRFESQSQYPNLARSMTLTEIDQLWIADITYIRLEMEFVYLAVVLEAVSQQVTA